MGRKRRSSNGDSGGATLSGFILKSIFGVVLIVLILTLAQCTVKKPQSPTWDTRLIVPLVNRTYSMSELISKLGQDEIGFDADSNVIFSISRDLDTFQIQQADLTLGAVSAGVTQQLGPIEVTAPAATTLDVPLSSIAPLALGGAIPPTSFIITNDLPTFASMTTATVSSGQVWVVVHNNLGLDLDSITITLHDVGYGNPLGSQSFTSGVADGATDSMAFDLSGATISDQLRCILDCHTPGGTLLVTGVQDISTSLIFSTPFTVSAATAAVPALSRSFSENIGLNRSTAVYEAILGSGTLAMTIDNNTRLAVSVSITFPDFVQDGLTLTVYRDITADTSINVTVDLTGAILQPQDLTHPQDLSIQVEASSLGSGGNPVQINQNHSFGVTASLSSMSVVSVTGVVAPTDVVVDPVAQTIDVPQGFDSVQLASATLSLEITNAVDLPGSLSLQMNGDNGKVLNLAGTISRGSSANPVASLIVDSSIADFMWPLPSSLTLTGTVTFGDGSTTGTLTTSDFLHARISIDAPFELIVHQSTIRPDISSESMDTSAMNNVADHVTSARLVYTLNNHLPLGANFSLLLNDDSATAYSSPQVSIDNLFITAASVNGSGIVTSTATTGEQIVELDSADIQVLRNPTLWIASQITLDSTGSQPVKLTAQDFVNLVARIEVDYRFDGQF